MIHKAKDLSPNQKAAIEGLLGRAIAENEVISIRCYVEEHITTMCTAGLC
jgi:hypothetical protein